MDSKSFLDKFKEMRIEHKKWEVDNFGKQDISLALLGIGEELGELQHAILKREQGIRGTQEEHMLHIKDAIGDTFIYLTSFLNKLTISCDFVDPFFQADISSFVEDFGEEDDKIIQFNILHDLIIGLGRLYALADIAKWSKGSKISIVDVLNKYGVTDEVFYAMKVAKDSEKNNVVEDAVWGFVNESFISWGKFYVALNRISIFLTGKQCVEHGLDVWENTVKKRNWKANKNNGTIEG